MIPYPDRISRARLPTPLEPMTRLTEKLGLPILMKRDDLTGSALSGNKIRKLEFLFAEARGLGANTVVTCGGEQSNHCRATAIAATQLGFGSVLLLRTADPAQPPAIEGNILLDKLAGAEIRWVSHEQYGKRAQVFGQVADELRARGKKPYLIPEGGSNALGAWGYVRCVEEMAAQLPAGPATLIYAAGSGGTGAGLILGVRLLRLPWRVVGINVCDDRDYFVQVIGDIVEEAIDRWKLDLPSRFERAQIEIRDGHVGLGYARSRPEELATLRDVARAEGVLLDPVYTGKAFHGLTEELRRDRNTFGERIVFLHTGGIYGLFPKAAELAPLL